MQRIAGTQRLRQILQPARLMASAEPCDRGCREHQQARSEDWRNHTRHIDLQRQMRGLVHVSALTAGASCVVHGDAPLGALHEHHECRRRQHQAKHHQQLEQRQLTVAGHPERMHYCTRQTRDDAREDQQRNTVANAALGHLLAQPHQKHRAGRQPNHG